MTAFRHLGNRLALVKAQRLDGQPGPPQIGLFHGDRRLGQRLGDALSIDVSSNDSWLCGISNLRTVGDGV